MEFGVEQRRWLGLREGDSVRLLASTSHLILLERCGASSQMPLPWDRDLVLTADVRAFPLADLLHLLHTSAKSGFLFFEDGAHAKSVFLHRGEVVFATSNQTFDRLGETLLRVGVISGEQFDTARRAYAPPARFGRVLVERGYLTPRELWNGVKVQVEEIVRSLFSYASGQVAFWEGEVSPDNVVRLSLPTRRLIAQGLRRRDELLRFVAWLEDPRVRLRTKQGAAQEFCGTEQMLLAAIGEASSFTEVCRRAGLDPLTGARTLQLLTLVGAAEACKSDEEVTALAEADALDEAAQVRGCVHVHLKLLCELAAPIVAVEGPDSIRDRLQAVADEAARRYPELLGSLRIGRGASLDPEDLVARALRFPGERTREVRLALGELVSYLEFDLLNHPRIAEPEQFLEAIEDLRSEL